MNKLLLIIIIMSNSITDSMTLELLGRWVSKAFFVEIEITVLFLMI